MEIYLVTAESGEYSDRQEWSVCAYRSKKLADEHAGKASNWLMETRKRCDDWFDLRELTSKKETGSPYDPHLAQTYSLDDVEYCVSVVELRDEIPTLDNQQDDTS